MNKCIHCSKIYKKVTNLNKHIEKCVYKIIFDKDYKNKELQEKNKILLIENEELKKLVKKIEKNNLNLNNKLEKSYERINYFKLKIDRLINY